MGLVRTVHTHSKAGSKEWDNVEGEGETTQLPAELHELAIALPFPSTHCGPWVARHTWFCSRLCLHQRKRHSRLIRHEVQKHHDKQTWVKKEEKITHTYTQCILFIYLSFIDVNTCWAPHLKMSSKCFTLATTVLFSASVLSSDVTLNEWLELYTACFEQPPKWLQRCYPNITNKISASTNSSTGTEALKLSLMMWMLTETATKRTFHIFSVAAVEWEKKEAEKKQGGGATLK